MSKAKRSGPREPDASGLSYSIDDMVPRRDEPAGSRMLGSSADLLKPIGAFLVDGANTRIATPSGRKHGSSSIFEATCFPVLSPSKVGGGVSLEDYVSPARASSLLISEVPQGGNAVGCGSVAKGSSPLYPPSVRCQLRFGSPQPPLPAGNPLSGSAPSTTPQLLSSSNWIPLVATMIKNIIRMRPTTAAPNVARTDHSLRALLGHCGVEEIDGALEALPDLLGAWLIGGNLIRVPDTDAISVHISDAHSNSGSYFTLSTTTLSAGGISPTNGSGVATTNVISYQLEEMLAHFHKQGSHDAFLNAAIAAQDTDVANNLHNRNTVDLIQSGMLRLEVVLNADIGSLWRYVPSTPGLCIVVGVCEEDEAVAHVMLDAKASVVPTWGGAELAAFGLYLGESKLGCSSSTPTTRGDKSRFPSVLNSDALGVASNSPTATLKTSPSIFASPSFTDRQAFGDTSLPSLTSPSKVECSVCVPTPLLASRNTETSLKSPLALLSSKEYLGQSQTQSPPAKRGRQRSVAGNLAGTGSMVVSISVQNKVGKRGDDRSENPNSNSSNGVIVTDKYTTIQRDTIPVLSSVQDGDDLLFLGLKADAIPPVSATPAAAVAAIPPPRPGARKGTPIMEVPVVEEPPSPAAQLQAQIDDERRRAAGSGQLWKPLTLWLGIQQTNALSERYRESALPITTPFQLDASQLCIFHAALCTALGDGAFMQEAVPSLICPDSISCFLGGQTLTLRRCLEAVRVRGGKVPQFAAQDALQELIELFQKEEDRQRMWGSTQLVVPPVSAENATVLLVRSSVHHSAAVEMCVSAMTCAAIHIEYAVSTKRALGPGGVTISGTACVRDAALQQRFEDALSLVSALNEVYNYSVV